MGRPTPPTLLFINGKAEETTAMVTKNVTGTVPISAVIDDPDSSQTVRLWVRYSTDKTFAHYFTRSGTFGAQGIRRTVNLDRLQKNTLYYLRVYTQDSTGAFSTNYNASSFWTDRYPLAPNLVAPAENITVDPTQPLTFDWQVVDPDEPETPVAGGFQLRIRTAGDALVPPGPWSTVTVSTGTATAWTRTAPYFKSSTMYEWQVRTRDAQGQWGAFSLIRSFITTGATKPPLPLAPGADVVVITDEPVTFSWAFRDPLPAAYQGNADVRYRVKNTTAWITIFGTNLIDPELTVNAGTLTPGYHYEWQVRTYRGTGVDVTSDWSESAYFWTVLTPGSAVTEELPLGEGVQGSLGIGVYRVMIYDRGGSVFRGEFRPETVSSLVWNRKRDDISNATFEVTNYNEDDAALLRMLHPWMHEVVIVRNEERVWEGPISTLTMTAGSVTVQARDVMNYLYRRILRQGYNDSYHLVNGVQLGLKTVVQRAESIALNCLGYADPNVLPYLTPIHTGGDARQSRIVPDYSKMAWEEIDDLASNAGLDYTVVGRRIIFWDTHQAPGVLPEMHDGDFSEPIVVSVYGMTLANYFAVTDGNGAWGGSFPAGLGSDDWLDGYGPVEMLASGYGDTADTAATTDPTALAAMQADLKAQASRNINNRWPAPAVIRVPDNAALSPDTNITMNQLVPGVWVPFRVETIVRPLMQMQKLDSVTVTVTEGRESVSVVLSPAPRASDDPDAAGEADGGADA